MNAEKIREVLDYVYDQAQEILTIGYFEADQYDFELVVERIRDKIETLDDDDLGGE